VSNALTGAWRRYRALPPLQRELATFGLMLLVAVTLLPLAIWGAGQVFLGDYLRDPTSGRTGGPLALLLDYLGGVLSGSPGHWFVLLGPYLILLGFRGARSLSKNVT
jgi:hypothetical protein